MRLISRLLFGRAAAPEMGGFRRYPRTASCLAAAVAALGEMDVEAGEGLSFRLVPGPGGRELLCLQATAAGTTAAETIEAAALEALDDEGLAALLADVLAALLADVLDLPGGPARPDRGGPRET